MTQQGLPRVLIETRLGSIEAEIDIQSAPETARNFLRFVDGNGYADAAFYRAVRPADDPHPTKVSVVQAGLYLARHAAAGEPIAHESTETTGLRHHKGALSMARDGVGTADSEFFIVVDASPELDAGGSRQPDGHGFAAFGRVVSGMDVVMGIQAQAQQPVAPLHGMLADPVPILSIKRLVT